MSKVISRTLFYLIVTTLIMAILLPMFFFISSSFYSGYEMYRFPKPFLPETHFDFQIHVDEEFGMYNLSIWDEETHSYELLISSSKARDFRRYMKRELSIVLEDEQIEADFAPAKEGPIELTYRKDMLYNYKTFFFHYKQS